jgi:hypothetical protein
MADSIVRRYLAKMAHFLRQPIVYSQIKSINVICEQNINICRSMVQLILSWHIANQYVLLPFILVVSGRSSGPAR